MKKNVLMKSKRMAAFALSLSMILSEGSLAGAAEVNAGDAEPAVNRIRRRDRQCRDRDNRSHRA